MKTTPDLSTVIWRKSSYSDGGANNCLEIADGYAHADIVPVRDSKTPASRPLLLSRAAWTAFVTHAGESAGGPTNGNR
ncbi:DUF397 domain-containing protein [Streptomyces sp. NPDC005931]|uniref:DUF397 domain-containing protein n=1 Tax=Streptomyces sp. NPDC005931 TaxID=3364737 RepID=UPI0036B14982